MIVTDQEILSAQRLLASTTGVYAEPAASATLAGLCKAITEGSVDARESIVLLVTGHGLKDVDAASKGVTIPSPVPPDIESARQFLRDRRP